MINRYVYYLLLHSTKLFMFYQIILLLYLIEHASSSSIVDSYALELHGRKLPFVGFCPKGFGIPLNLTDPQLILIDDTHCAMECVAPLFSDNYYKHTSSFVILFNSIGCGTLLLLLSTLLLDTKHPPLGYISLIAIFFSVSASCIIFYGYFIPMEQSFCASAYTTNSYHQGMNNFCNWQSLVMYWSGMGLIINWTVQMMNIFAIVCLNIRNTSKFKPYFIAIMFGVPTLLTINFWAKGLYGYSRGSLFCFVSDAVNTNADLSVFYYPMAVFAIIGIGFMMCVFGKAVWWITHLNSKILPEDRYNTTQSGQTAIQETPRQPIQQTPHQQNVLQAVSQTPRQQTVLQSSQQTPRQHVSQTVIQPVSQTAIHPIAQTPRQPIAQSAISQTPRQPIAQTPRSITPRKRNKSNYGFIDYFAPFLSPLIKIYNTTIKPLQSSLLFVSLYAFCIIGFAVGRNYSLRHQLDNNSIVATWVQCVFTKYYGFFFYVMQNTSLAQEYADEQCGSAPELMYNNVIYNWRYIVTVAHGLFVSFVFIRGKSMLIIAESVITFGNSVLKKESSFETFEMVDMTPCEDELMDSFNESRSSNSSVEDELQQLQALANNPPQPAIDVVADAPPAPPV